MNSLLTNPTLGHDVNIHVADINRVSCVALGLEFSLPALLHALKLCTCSVANQEKDVVSEGSEDGTCR